MPETPDTCLGPLSEVDLRLRALLRFLDGRSEFATFKDLRAAHPTYDPHTGEEIPPARPRTPPAESTGK